MRKNKVETIKGYGKLTGPAQNGLLTIEVTSGGKSNLVKTKNVILATGSDARLSPVEDEDISKELARVYRKRAINFHTGATVEKVEKTKSGIAVTFTVGGKQQKIEAEKILIAVGRKPRTENVGLEKTRIKHDRGFIKADSWMQTNEPGIYAIGAIGRGTPNLAQV